MQHIKLDKLSYSKHVLQSIEKGHTIEKKKENLNQHITKKKSNGLKHILKCSASLIIKRCKLKS